MKWGKNDPGKISAKSDNWFKSYGQKFEKKALFRNRVPGTNYPVLGYPDFANYPVPDKPTQDWFLTIIEIMKLLNEELNMTWR